MGATGPWLLFTVQFLAQIGTTHVWVLALMARLHGGYCPGIRLPPNLGLPRSLPPKDCCSVVGALTLWSSGASWPSESLSCALSKRVSNKAEHAAHARPAPVAAAREGPRVSVSVSVRPAPVAQSRSHSYSREPPADGHHRSCSEYDIGGSDDTPRNFC